MTTLSNNNQLNSAFRTLQDREDLKTNIYKAFPQTESGNTSNTSSTSANSTDTCASSLDGPSKKLAVSATGKDFTQQSQSQNEPDQLLFTKKAIRNSRPSSNQLSVLVASHSTNASRSSTSPTNSFADSASVDNPLRESFTPISSSLQIGAQFSFKSTNHIDEAAAAAVSMPHVADAQSPPTNKMTLSRTYTSPEKAKRLASESVLPTLCVRAAPNVKLLGLHRTNSSIETCSNTQRKQVETVSLPASPTSKESLLAGLARRNGSMTSLVSVGAGSMVQPPRQLRSLKTPLYVPSVLRRTLTVDKLSGLNTTTTPARTLLQLPAVSVPGSPISSLPILGTPSKAHWKPNHSRANCASCLSAFTLFSRRHHCRKCGDVFCEADSRYAVKLDQSCDFHYLGVKSRACGRCFEGWQTFLDSGANVGVCEESVLYDDDSSLFEDGMSDSESLRSLSHDAMASRPAVTRSSSSSSSIGSSSSGSNNNTNSMLDNNASSTTLTVSQMEPSAVAVGSVPANWNWSTF